MVKNKVMKKILLFALLFTVGYLYFQYSGEDENSTPTDIRSTSQVEETTSCQSPIQVYQDPSRLPLREFVLAQMGDLDGKTVLDIGAGPGFFAFEMAKEAGKVIATELDPLFTNYMREEVTRLNLKNFEVRTANARQSELKGLQVDYALMVYAFHYLDDPKVFLSRLKEAMVTEGKLFIANAQLSPAIVRDYLEQAGFTDVREAYYTMESTGCGPQQVQLVSGTLSSSGLAVSR